MARWPVWMTVSMLWTRHRGTGGSKRQVDLEIRLAGLHGPEIPTVVSSEKPPFSALMFGGYVPIKSVIWHFAHVSTPNDRGMNEPGKLFLRLARRSLRAHATLGCAQR
jgi:hypothetical protein